MVLQNLGDHMQELRGSTRTCPLANSQHSPGLSHAGYTIPPDDASSVAHRHIATPFEVLKEGQEVKVKVLDLNVDEKRISLSIKETEEAPAASAPAPKSDRPARQPKETHIAEEYQNQGLNLTLGERFGDKLSKFK